MELVRETGEQELGLKVSLGVLVLLAADKKILQVGQFQEKLALKWES